MSREDTLPWTTPRCNRLLRPLSSKLAKLRKELEKSRTAAVDSRNVSSAFAIKCSPRKTTNFTRPAHKPRGFEKARDPDWRPDAKQGAGKKTTYGGRGRGRPTGLQRNGSNTGNGSRPGEIAFTPVISRMSGQLHSSPQVPISPLKKYAKNRGPLLVNTDTIAEHITGDSRKLVQGLSEAYANLLQATKAGGERRWKGTRSLMSACLRKVPAYIELEDHFAKLDRLEEDCEEEDRDVANEIYEHLEAQFEQEHGQGWRPFRQVVRAHGTTLVCDAITDEVLSLDNALTLVTHCLNASAWDEAEQLLLAYAPLLEPVSIPINVRANLFDAQRSPYLFCVKTFVEQTGRHRLLYDLLEHMAALELLPLEWLATDSMRPIWDRVVRTITVNDQRMLGSASRFFETVTLASIGLPDERLLQYVKAGSTWRRFVPSSRAELRQALSTTFSSLSTVLCSIALVNSSRDDAAGKSVACRISRALDAAVVAISTRSDLEDELKLLNAHADDLQIMTQRAFWINFASIIAHLGGCSSDETIISFDVTTAISVMNWIAAKYSSGNPSRDVNLASVLASIPTFVSSAARGTGRIWKDDGFDQLQRLLEALMAVSGCRLPHKLWTLKRIALESAMDFANDTGDAEHMAYARQIERKMQTQGRLVIVQSPQKNDSPSGSGGFRWEEGIGEWVTCTPFAKSNVKRAQRPPVRALELLPTPEQSGDDQSEVGELLDGIVESPAWETASFDREDDDAIPQSSPIKRVPRMSTSSLGKRIRAVSPKVVIPYKRIQLARADATVAKFYPELPEDEHDGPRRSRRPRKEIQALTSRLRTQRSRTSLESGLRDLKRPIYVDELEDDDTDLLTSIASESEDELEASSQSSTSTGSKPANLRMSTSRGTLIAVDEDEDEDEDEDDASERDELAKTPARLYPQLRKRVGSRLAMRTRNKWWKVEGGVEGDSEDGSEDELSFH